MALPARPHNHDRGDADRGDMVMGWLAKVAAVLAVVAVIGIDGVTVAEAKVSVVDNANDAAESARDDWASSHSIEHAYQVAESSVKQANDADSIKPSDFSVTSGGVVTLTVTRPIHTLVAKYLGRESLKVVSAQVTATPAVP